jgi:hypothetical protein
MADYSIYTLFKLERSASPLQILDQCKDQCSKWNIGTVQRRLATTMNLEQASLAAERVFMDGNDYLKSSAAILLDPSSRQCYDAWLDAMVSQSPETMALTRSRLLWFNQMTNGIHFGEKMIEMLDSSPKTVAKIQRNLPVLKENTVVLSSPQCRGCHSSFSFSKDYLVLHCHCTTRVGHVNCLESFSTRVKNKCPVCRQQLLKRHQVSKYLFWNVKEKYKFV